jgi:hypothetical protein
MEHAKKMVLVEPRMLQELQAHIEYKNLLKPAHNKRKADLSMELHDVLDQQSMSDDLKAKQYQQTFRRLRNMDDSISQLDKSVINPMTPPVGRRQHPQQQQIVKTPKPKRAKTIRWDQY